MLNQAEKGLLFRSLHHREEAFIIPNPWDIGTARLLAGLGFEALATTSAGFAFSLGQPDQSIGRDAILTHITAIASATHLPVNADLENGFGDSPATVAQTFELAAKTGVVGASIEDATGRPDEPIYDESLATERVRAAAEVVRALPFAFTLTARAENYLVGRPDLRNTIQRLQLYQDAGADVLFAPGLTNKQEIAAVVSSLARPVNVLMGLQGAQFNLAELSDLGVKRVSVGSSLSRAALAEFLRAGREMKDHGTFNFAKQALSFQEINETFRNR